MTTPCDRVLALLEDVRQTGTDQWMAKCPSHDDRTPSLSIGEGDDGCVLLHDFSSRCSVPDVLAALGLDYTDLYYPQHLQSGPTRRARRRAPRIPASDALELLEVETLTVEIIAHRLAQGDPVEEHRELLDRASGRIAAIREAWIRRP